MRSFVAALLCLVALGQQEPKPEPAGPAPGHDDACAKACGDCARACEQCSAHCTALVADGKADHLPTLRATRDCATICAAAAAIEGRDGPFGDVITGACAEACKRCGAACGRHPDPMMQACAAACKACEAACRGAAKHHGHKH